MLITTLSTLLDIMNTALPIIVTDGPIIHTHIMDTMDIMDIMDTGAIFPLLALETRVLFTVSS